MMNIAIPTWEGDKARQTINTAYVKYVADAGYNPVLISPMTSMEFALATCSGLLLPGGIDVDPIFYGQGNWACFNTDVEKDNFERSLLYAFVNAGRSVFGICRGFQLIAREVIKWSKKHKEMVNFEYRQHVESHSQVNGTETPRGQASHMVQTDAARLYGNVPNVMHMMGVNSMHHQCLCGKPLEKSFLVGDIRMLAVTNRGMAASSKQMVVEAADFLLWPGAKVRGVQWHPEELSDVALIQNFFGKEVPDALVNEAGV